MTLSLADRRQLAAVANDSQMLLYFIVSTQADKLFKEVGEAFILGSANRRQWMLKLFDCTDPALSIQEQRDRLEAFEAAWKKRGTA